MTQQNESQQREPGKTGPVGRTVNVGIDIGYIVMWAVITIIGIAGLFTPVRLWSLLVIAGGGWYLYRNIRNAVLHSRGHQ